MTPIADLHCDLLSFLAENPLHSIDDPRSNASYSHMRKGNVATQVLAIFTDGGASSFAQGKKQIACLKNLLLQHGQRYRLLDATLSPSSDYISVIPAIENACSICSNTMSIDEGLLELDQLLSLFKRILYISLTWDGENRFGGGNGSNLGLKEDGKRILEWMDGKKVAIDLSHTSDFLADDILNYIDKKSLKIPVIASHSNARAIINRPRNLPDFLIKEIFARKGLIGLNFFAPFLGDHSSALLQHIEHFLDLGGEDSLCFGADFFPDLLAETLLKKYQSTTCFFPDLPNSSCYPSVLSMIQQDLHLNKTKTDKIAYKNFERHRSTSL